MPKLLTAKQKYITLAKGNFSSRRCLILIQSSLADKTPTGSKQLSRGGGEGWGESSLKSFKSL